MRRSPSLVIGLAALAAVAGSIASAANTPPIATTTVQRAVPRPPTPPGLVALEASASSVTVGWTDSSTNEVGFTVFRRDLQGAWQSAYTTRTRNSAGTGQSYSWVDTSLSLSGQCYMVAAVDSIGAGDTSEECTVRPDPSRFPQNANDPVSLQWTGLSGTNDYENPLVNISESQVGDFSLRQEKASLIETHETWGINLKWVPISSLTPWQIEAQGGPTLMRGQAVALHVNGGGWLTYGHETYGVDLQFSSTPVYQWYLLGGPAGSPIGTAPFALWNSAARQYLIASHEDYGVDLGWYTPTPPATGSGTTLSTSVTMVADPQNEGFVPFVGSFGGGVGNKSTLLQVGNPSNGPTLFFLKNGSTNDDCGNSSKVITLAPGATLKPADMQAIWGSATPSMAQALPFVACAQTNASSVTVNVTYRTS